MMEQTPETNRLPPDTAPTGEPLSDTRQMSQELATLTERLRTLEERDLPAQEIEQRRLREALETTQQSLLGMQDERDQFKSRFETLARQQQVNRLAQQSGFSDPEYLDYLLQRDAVDPDNTENTDRFLLQLRDRHPRFFTLALKSGSGTVAPAAAEFPGVGNAIPSGTDGIIGMLRQAPEFR